MTTTPLDLGRDFFDSAETEIFKHGIRESLGIRRIRLDAWSGRQSQLVGCLMTLLKLGETDPRSLADSPIKTLRRSFWRWQLF
jgi:hypothetical protein